MITCPNCQNPEKPGALFCQRCGSRLSPYPQTRPFAPDFTEPLESQGNGTPMIGLALAISDEGQVLPLSGKDEYTIGRFANDQTVCPDVDLSSFFAYEKGVSRLHISVKISGGTVTVTDLGSINGTYLNGNRILPYQAYPLAHGDTLTLGKLKMQVLIREK